MRYFKGACYLASLICFVLAACGLNGRLISAGLGLWVLADDVLPMLD